MWLCVFNIVNRKTEMIMPFLVYGCIHFQWTNSDDDQRKFIEQCTSFAFWFVHWNCFFLLSSFTIFQCKTKKNNEKHTLTHDKQIFRYIEQQEIEKVMITKVEKKMKSWNSSCSQWFSTNENRSKSNQFIVDAMHCLKRSRKILRL